MIAAAGADTDAVTLGDLTAGHVDAFEDELIARYPAGIRTPYLMMGYLVR